jgi:serine protease Do
LCPAAIRRLPSGFFYAAVGPTQFHPRGQLLIPCSKPMTMAPELRRFVPHRCVTVIGVVAVLAFISITATAQPTDVAGTSAAAPTTLLPTARNDREAEYASLARDVEAFGHELGLVKRVVKLVAPAVVKIESNPLPRFQGSMHIEEAGSGVLVQLESRPYVLTNRHVIRHSTPDRIEIHLPDGRTFHPTRIWSDSETDVAVMGIDASGLATARFGNSDALEIGDFVLAIGSPFGLSQSVTRGIVSAMGRHNLDLGDDDLKWQNFIQTDAAINPGNSGGPLVNLRGEIVGLNTAIASASGGNEGIGFSIPINIVARTARALVAHGRVPRGYLGVDLHDQFTVRTARDLGLHHLVGTLVTATKANSPAVRADIRPNDVIVQFNGVTIENDAHLRGLVKLSEIGKPVELLIYREGKPLRKTVEIGSFDVVD